MEKWKILRKFDQITHLIFQLFIKIISVFNNFHLFIKWTLNFGRGSFLFHGKWRNQAKTSCTMKISKTHWLWKYWPFFQRKNVRSNTRNYVMKGSGNKLTIGCLLIRWKFEGPSDSFKALLDMAAVHSSCRLCIHLATTIREKEERSPDVPFRPCKCSRGKDTVYHAYVRERGRFEMESIFLR